jgi:hypothetical protein
MTPNPHRGSDFADFLAEEGLTPTMKPTNELPAQLREFNRWRRCDEAMEQPPPARIGAMIDEAADRLEKLEEQLAANHAAIKLMGKWLEDERALADKLAASLEDCRDDSAELLSDHSWWQDEPRCGYAERYKENAKNITRAVEALATWKEARRV